MLRLTLLSARDGSFLACIADRGGLPFVLDAGDRRVIDDATQRVLHGFTMFRKGHLLTAQPGDDNLLEYLAEYYAGEGVLVFFEEPNWEGRRRDPPSTVDPEDEPARLAPLVLGELGDEDEPTELIRART